LSTVVRSHWQIENRLHWRLDVVMNEDQDRTRLGHGPDNLAVLRHMALNATKKRAPTAPCEESSNEPAGTTTFLIRLLNMFCYAIALGIGMAGIHRSSTLLKTLSRFHN